MVEIPLTQGRVALIDDDDAERVRAFRWRAVWSEKSSTWYAYRSVPKSREGYYPAGMHRFLVGAQPGQEVHHDNHDGLDNRRSNLVLCTHLQNTQHRVGLPSRRRSRFNGVSQYAPCGWSARIRVNGKPTYLGSFPTEEAAALAYDQAAVAAFGPFALTNAALFPELLKGVAS